MNNFLLSAVGVLLCTGPLWGGAIGYMLARRGWRLRNPFHQAEDEE